MPFRLTFSKNGEPQSAQVDSGMENAVPLVLKILGFSFAGYFSVYPLYSWPGVL